MKAIKTFSKQPGKERSSEVSCALCGARNVKKLYSCDTYAYVRCSECGLVYQFPQPVYEDLRHRYDGEYFQYEIENESRFLSLMVKGLADIGIDFIEKEVPCKRFLDIGCATGILLEHMRNRGWEAVGVEPCAESAAYGSRTRKLPIKACTLGEAVFGDSSFSFVHASHVIEHLNEPGAFLDEIRRILIPGGYTALVTPNIGGLQSVLFGKNWRSAIADHLYLFSQQTLGRMLCDRGFSIFCIKTWGGLALGTVPGWIKTPVDRMAKAFGFGDVMIICAVKNHI